MAASDASSAPAPQAQKKFHNHDPFSGVVLLPVVQFPRLAAKVQEYCDVCRGPCQGENKL